MTASLSLQKPKQLRGNTSSKGQFFLTMPALVASLLITPLGAETSTAESIEESTPQQYLSSQFHYLVPDSEREIARNGMGFGVQYGRRWKEHLWWESEVSGYSLDSGVDGSSDFYMGGVTTGLAYVFGDRRGFSPYLVAAIGAMYSDVVPDENDGIHFHANAGLGAVTAPVFDNGLKLRAEARYLYDYADNDATPTQESQSDFGDWRFSLGIEVPLGYTRVKTIERIVYKTREVEVEKIVEKPFVDTDRDGIADDRDQCPDTLPDARVDVQGCLIVNQTITFNNINFQPNAAVISAGSRAPLDRLVQTLRSQSDFNVQIAGHSDNTGSAEYNLQLSDQRARAVRQYLIDQGVDSERLAARGYGESQPVADNDTPAGRAMNRRVEFRVLEQGTK